MEILEIIRRPLITEKSTALQGKNKYMFEVAPGSNKRQIKEAVEKAFKVKVVSVNVMTVAGETRRIGGRRRKVTTSSWKKAVVTLKKGDSIQLFGSM